MWDAIYDKCYTTIKGGLTLPQQCADELELDGIDTEYMHAFNNKTTAFNGTAITGSVILPVNKNELMRDVSIMLINLQYNFTAQVRVECDNL